MIQKRKQGNGKVRYGVRVNQGGKPVWVGTFDTIAEARSAESKARSHRITDPRWTCDKWADHHLEQLRDRVKSSSYDTAESALRGFKTDYKAIPLHRVDKVSAQGWALKNRWRVPAVVALFNAAVDAELIDRNPFKGLAKRGKGRKNLAPLSENEVTRLGQTALEAHGPEYGPMVRAHILFLAYTGMRVGETFALEWADLDFDAKRINISRRVYKGSVDLPKEGKPKSVVLAPKAADALSALPRDTAYVFSGKKGGRLSQTLLSWYWESVTAKFGKKVTPHELRHFAGHYLYVTLGLPARVVAVQLGHNDGGKLVEQLYGHGDVGALEALDKAFENVVPIERAKSHGS